MATITTDPNHPNLKHGVDEKPTQQSKAYLTLPKAELEKGFVRPFRLEYKHTTCGTNTIMPGECAKTYARDPKFYGSTYCCFCQKHRPVQEFTWLDDGTALGT